MRTIGDKRLYPVGRLDYDSEGLLLLTNDGNLTYKLTHPSSEIPKTYVVKIEGTIEESDLAALRKGVTVDGVKYGRSKVKVTGIEKVGGSKKATIDPKDVRAREAIDAPTICKTYIRASKSSFLKAKTAKSGKCLKRWRKRWCS